MQTLLFFFWDTGFWILIFGIPIVLVIGRVSRIGRNRSTEETSAAEVETADEFRDDFTLADTSECDGLTTAQNEEWRKRIEWLNVVPGSDEWKKEKNEE